MFIAGGAFVGLDTIVKSRIRGTSIGFGAEVNSKDNGEQHLDKTTPDDLVRFGLIPEFVGRFPAWVALRELDKPALIRILKEVKHNYVSQYQWLFKQDEVDLEFTSDSLDLIAERTIKNKTCARGLHSELERVLLPHMFDLPRYKTANILNVTINKTQVNTPMTLLQENL